MFNLSELVERNRADALRRRFLQDISMPVFKFFKMTVEPVIFGRGIRLFSEENFDRKLKLLDIEQFSRDEVRLHYRVLKRR